MIPAEQTVLERLAGVETTLEHMATRTHVAAIEARLASVETTLEHMATRTHVAAIEARLASVETALKHMATQADLVAVEARIGAIEATIGTAAWGFGVALAAVTALLAGLQVYYGSRRGAASAA